MQRIQTNSSPPEQCRRPRTSADLTDAELQLVGVMSHHQFGRLENMPVRGGQPLLDRSVKVVCVERMGSKCGGTNVPSGEFELKEAHYDLFDRLARLQNGTILKLEFKHGLPFLIEIEVMGTSQI